MRHHRRDAAAARPARAAAAAPGPEAGVATPAAAFKGRIRALQRPDGQWRVDAGVDVSIPQGAFERTLASGAGTGLPAAGLVSRRNDTVLVLGRRANGTYFLRLRKVRIGFGTPTTLDAEIAGDGLAVFRWTLTLASNGLRFVPDAGAQAEVRLSLRAAAFAPQLRLPAGKVHADFPGWPPGGVDLPAIVSPNASRSGAGTAQGTTRAWADLPGFPLVQYRVDNPGIRVSLKGQALEAVFRAGRVRLRSKATRPDTDQRWFEVHAGVPDVTVRADGEVRLPLPSLPSLGDPLKAARDLCFMTVPAVGWTVLGQVTQKDRDEGLARCRALHPEPPSVNLPATLRLPLLSVL